MEKRIGRGLICSIDDLRWRICLDNTHISKDLTAVSVESGPLKNNVDVVSDLVVNSGCQSQKCTW